MDSTIEISDSSANQTVVLDDTDDEKSKNNSSVQILDSSNDDPKEDDDETASHFVTASTTGKFLMENTPPKVTSTPRQIVQNAPKDHEQSTMIFHDVEDEFLHDESFAEPVEREKHPSEKDEDEDSAIESEKTPLLIENDALQKSDE